MFVIPCSPCLEYPIENLTRGRMYPYQMIAPKFKCILFSFHKISWFIAKVMFASIPSNMIEDCRMHIFLHLVDNLQTPKTRISFFGHRLQGFAAFHSFIWQFKKPGFGENNKNTVYVLPIKIGKINSGHCRPNKEKRVLTLFLLPYFYICTRCCLPR